VPTGEGVLVDGPLGLTGIETVVLPEHWGPSLKKGCQKPVLKDRLEQAKRRGKEPAVGR
jgi:hypothetical protein